jgi:hypothetical protein
MLFENNIQNIKFTDFLTLLYRSKFLIIFILICSALVSYLYVKDLNTKYQASSSIFLGKFSRDLYSTEIIKINDILYDIENFNPETIFVNQEQRIINIYAFGNSKEQTNNIVSKISNDIILLTNTIIQKKLDISLKEIEFTDNLIEIMESELTRVLSQSTHKIETNNLDFKTINLQKELFNLKFKKLGDQPTAIYSKPLGNLISTSEEPKKLLIIFSALILGFIFAIFVVFAKITIFEKLSLIRNS